MEVFSKMSFAEWFAEHAGLIANFATLAMLLVWLFYTLLFYRDFKQQRSPLIVIHQAQGHGLESTCLLVNLSKEPIHVLCVLMVAHTEDGTLIHRVTNTQRLSPEQDSHWKVQDLIKQGPLPTGYFLALGSFEEMLKGAGLLDPAEIATGDARPERIRSLARSVGRIEIRIVALHGAYQAPIGACRTFRVNASNGELGFEPAMVLTRQMASRSERREVRRWLAACLPPGAR